MSRDVLGCLLPHATCLAVTPHQAAQDLTDTHCAQECTFSPELLAAYRPTRRHANGSAAVQQQQPSEAGSMSPSLQKFQVGLASTIGLCLPMTPPGVTSLSRS